MEIKDSVSVHDDIKFVARVYNNQLFINLHEKDEETGSFAPMVATVRGSYTPRFNFGEYQGTLTTVKIPISKFGFNDKHDAEVQKSFAILEANDKRIASAVEQFCNEHDYTTFIKIGQGKTISAPLEFVSNLSTKQSKGNSYTTFAVKPQLERVNEVTYDQKITSEFVIDGVSMKNKSRKEIWKTIEGSSFIVGAVGTYGLSLVNKKLYLSVKNAVIVMQTYTHPKPFDEKKAIGTFTEEFKEFAELTLEGEEDDETTIDAILGNAANYNPDEI